jgi:hypothetical protein
MLVENFLSQHLIEKYCKKYPRLASGLIALISVVIAIVAPTGPYHSVEKSEYGPLKTGEFYGKGTFK